MRQKVKLTQAPSLRLLPGGSCQRSWLRESASSTNYRILKVSEKGILTPSPSKRTKNFFAHAHRVCYSVILLFCFSILLFFYSSVILLYLLFNFSSFLLCFFLLFVFSFFFCFVTLPKCYKCVTNLWHSSLQNYY